MENIEKNIYEIENLRCSYDGEDIVLHIEHLDIPEKKIVFFVGKSGIGKSTILETLGFMNNTINIKNVNKEDVNREECVTFKYDGESVFNVWRLNSKNRDKALSELRKNFSFIFQQDNLMPNFSAKQNVMITAMLQGKTYKVAEDEADEIIKKLWEGEIDKEKELNETTKNFQQNSKLSNVKDRPISKWSGGEKQRLAFARAIIPNFSVLFGDEPTGNLDSATAVCLMDVLKKAVENKATAIIVSHDIKLAVDYADIIVLILNKPTLSTMSKRKSVGCINHDSIYKKENNVYWDHCGEKIEKETLCKVLCDKLK